MGKTPMQAALEAADEIGMAVIATTFALVAVFLPTAFMGGIPGKFFKQFGWTAVLAILASLLVARLLTPMMAAYILKPTAHREEKDGWLMQRYMRDDAVVPEPPAGHGDRLRPVLRRLDRAGAAAADRLRAAGRPRRRPRSTSNCRPARRWPKPASVAEQARAGGHAGQGREGRVQLDRRRLQRRRVRPGRGGRSAPRGADPDHRAPHRPQGVARRDRTPDPRASSTRSRARASTSARPIPASRCSWCCAAKTRSR